MKKTIILSFSLVLVGALVLTGCGEKIAEEAAENALETATGESAEVDVDDNSVTVNTNAGSWTAGEEVDLPSGFPSDIYVIEGTIKAATTITEGEVYSVSIETDKSVAEAKSEYETELENDGWGITVSLSMEGVSSLSAEKEDRIVTVTISEDDDTEKTIVIIGTSKNE